MSAVPSVTPPEPPLPAVAWVYARLAAVALCWGGTFIAGRTLAGALPPMTAATGRFAVAAALLLALVWRQHGRIPLPTRGQLLATFALGLAGVFLYNIFFFAALSRMPAGRTALFVALTPIVTTVLLAVFCGERLSWRRWLGVALGFCGAAVIISRGDLLGAARDLRGAMGHGELYMLGAVLSWSLYTILGRGALRTLTPLLATTYAATWGVLMLALGAIAEWPSVSMAQFTAPVLGSIFYLGALGTVVAFVWYYDGVRAIGPARAAVFTNLVPVFGVLLAALLLGETLSWSMAVGGALAIGGVTLVNRTAR